MEEYIRRGFRSKAFLPVIVVVAAILGLLAIPNTFMNPVYSQFESCKARVLSVNNDSLSYAGVVVYGEQHCEVELLSGSHKGKICEAMNMMGGSLSLDKQFAAGDIALVVVGARDRQNIFKVTMVDHYRIR